jgi:heparin/heparan-sulfate lyase
MAYQNPQTWSEGGDAPTYFSRFWHRYDVERPSQPAELLVVHVSFVTKNNNRNYVPPDQDTCVTYLASIKRAEVDTDGSLRLAWWHGNEQMKGPLQPVAIVQAEAGDNRGMGGAAKLLTPALNNGNGTILEGHWGATSHGDCGEGSVIFYGDNNSLVWQRELIAFEIGVNSSMAMNIFQLDAAGVRVKLLESAERMIGVAQSPDPVCHFRVLLRGSMAEVYVNDVLLLPVPLPHTVSASGGLPSWAAGVRAAEVRTALRGSWAQARLQAWIMSLPPLFPMTLSASAVKSDNEETNTSMLMSMAYYKLYGDDIDGGVGKNASDWLSKFRQYNVFVASPGLTPPQIAKVRRDIPNVTTLAYTDLALVYAGRGTPAANGCCTAHLSNFSKYWDPRWAVTNLRTGLPICPFATLASPVDAEPGIDAPTWTNFYRRERPELHLDADGAPAFLLNGVEYGKQHPDHQYSFTLMQRVDSTLKTDDEPPPPPSYPAVPPGHPRVYMRPMDLPRLRAKAADHGARQLWQAVTNRPDDPVVQAFLSLIHQNRSLCALAVANQTSVVAAILAKRPASGRLPDKELSGVGRTFFSAMHTTSVVFDWCYDTLDHDAKTYFIDGIKALANMDAPGYPIDFGNATSPPHWDTIAGHPCEGWIFTGQLPGGIAMYDDDPSMYEGAARYFFEGLLPVRKLAYKALKHYQGTHYTYARYEHEIASAMIWNAIGKPDVFPPTQPAVMSDYVYSLLPQGDMVTYGDCNISPAETMEQGHCLSMAAALYANRTAPKGESVLPAHLRYVVDNPPVAGASWSDNYRKGLMAVLNFIFVDTTPESTSIEELPTARYFPDPMGEVIVRTGWDLKKSSADTVVALRVGGLFFGNHQRRDAGTFQIYHKGALAASSGQYGSYGSSHWHNYYHSSISVNSLLIYDPDEGTDNLKNNSGVNVGGQRMPISNSPKDLTALLNVSNKYRIGSVIAHGWGNSAGAEAQQHGAAAVSDWHWLSGSITDAYCANKTNHVSRSFLVWTWPAAAGGRTVAVVIFDRVSSTKAEFRKTFLLHTMEQPTITACRTGAALSESESSGCEVEATAGSSGSGALSGTFLLPEAVHTKVVGGPGHVYEAGGQNWPPKNPYNKALGLSGQWRLEVSPAIAQLDDIFLSVWQPHDAGVVAPHASRVRFEHGHSPSIVGVQIAERLAVFVSAAEGLGNMTSLDLSHAKGIVWGSAGRVSLHACGLSEGKWRTASNRLLATVAAPSFCLQASVSAADLSSGPLEGPHSDWPSM